MNAKNDIELTVRMPREDATAMHAALDGFARGRVADTLHRMLTKALAAPLHEAKVEDDTRNGLTFMREVVPLYEGDFRRPQLP